MGWRRCAARAMMIEYCWRSSMVEPWFCKPVVVGSSPIASSIACKTELCARFFLFCGVACAVPCVFLFARVYLRSCACRCVRTVQYPAPARIPPQAPAFSCVPSHSLLKNFTFNLYSARATCAGRCTISCMHGMAGCVCPRDVLEI